MAHREVSATAVYASGVEARRAQEFRGNRGEGFHVFDRADVGKRQTLAGEQAVQAGVAGREGLQGIGVRFRYGLDAGARPQAEFGTAFAGAQQQQRGAVGDRRAVRDAVQVAHFGQPGDPGGQQRVVAERAECREGWREARQVRDGQRGPDHFVAFNPGAVGAPHRHHGRRVAALGPGLARTAVRVDGDRVDFVAGDVVQRGEQVRDDRR